jgi:hypothetical protein
MTNDRLALIARQRLFDWQLARDQQSRAAAALVAHRTHDLLGFIQIVRLVSEHVVKTADAMGQEFIGDMVLSADKAQVELRDMLDLARPPLVVERGAPLGPVLEATRAALAPAITVAIDLQAPAELCTRCTAIELDYILTAIALDAGTDAVSILVRARTLEGQPWMEVIRATDIEPAGDRADLIGLEVLAERRGGELSRSERRGGGEELVVALPVVS